MCIYTYICTHIIHIHRWRYIRCDHHANRDQFYELPGNLFGNMRSRVSLSLSLSLPLSLSLSLSLSLALALTLSLYQIVLIYCIQFQFVTLKIATRRIVGGSTVTGHT